jgi:hypothetical protein
MESAQHEAARAVIVPLMYGLTKCALATKSRMKDDISHEESHAL